MTIADELAKLKKLLDEGVISKDEFENLKNRAMRPATELSQLVEVVVPHDSVLPPPAPAPSAEKWLLGRLLVGLAFVISVPGAALCMFGGAAWMTQAGSGGRSTPTPPCCSSWVSC